MIRNFLEILIIVLSVSFSFTLVGQSSQNFVSLFKGKNLENVNFSSVVEDHQGFIWLSSRNGLYKYDGYDLTFLSFSDILGREFKNERSTFLFTDNEEKIWISLYDGELIKIESSDVFLNSKNSSTIPTIHQQITCSTKVSDGLWLGSDQGTIYFYDNSSCKLDSLTSIQTIDNNNAKINSIIVINDDLLYFSTNGGNIFSYKRGDSQPIARQDLPVSINLIKTQIGEIWAFVDGQGIYLFDIALNSLRDFNHNQSDEAIFSNALFYKLYEQKNGRIWVATDGAGLISIHPVSKKMNIFRHNPLNKFSLSNNTVWSICSDHHQNIWIVTKGGEIQILPNSANQIQYYSGSKDNSPSRILSIFKDKEDYLWVGTDGKGLINVTPAGETKAVPADNLSSFPGKYIQAIEEDSKGNILIGTYLNGLWMYHKKSKTFKQIDLGKSEDHDLKDIRSIFRDKKDRIWIATYNTLHVYSANLQGVVKFFSHKNGLYGDVSQAICEDNKGRLWIAINNGGLFTLEENVKDFSKSYFQQHLYHDKLSGDNHNYNIASMEFDSKNTLWLVTVSGALISYDINKKSYTSYKDFDPIKNLSLSGIEIDEQDNLWLSSDNGIIHYHPGQQELEYYHQTDGLQGNLFLRRSSYKDADHNLYFGGSNGLNIFHPKNMLPKSTSAKIYFTDLNVLNQSIHKIVPDQAVAGINNIDQLNLKYNQSSFSFRFSAIDNLLSSNFHYAYRLKGFNDEWIVPNKELVATFTNIKNGDYIFEVKAGAKKGEWDIPTKAIMLSIAPPWWFSTWAYLLYFTLLSLIAYYSYSWFSLRAKLKKEEWLHRKESEMYAMKMNFFTKMSNEIQTPLTLILGPIENLLRSFSDKTNPAYKKLKIISNNARRLSKITTELTSQRDLELGKLSISIARSDLIRDLQEICLSFEELAEFKSIHFIQRYPTEKLEIWYDSDKIEHVIYNLLFNAFKFTPRGGEVKLTVDQINNHQDVKIIIHDTGPGIPKEDLDKIFGLFYQSKLGKKVKGQGIGLALSKEIVTMHKGTISAQSSKDFGTKFIFTLPIAQPSPEGGEKIEEKNTPLTASHVSDSSLEPRTELGEVDYFPILNSSEGHTGEVSRKVLIVEDNHNMQIFLESVFEKKYQILFADDGEMGISMAEKTNPDLIISDVMMPNLSGIEMAKILHKQKFTQHIPIILMSAHLQENAKVRGLKAGAVEYIQKPFDIQELILKVDNIIQHSADLISRYRTNKISSPDDEGKMSAEEIFIANLTEEIKASAENPNFKLEDLASTLNMSYSSIYRKCQAITGKSLVEYVRWIRIKNSVSLFVKQGHSISEAAYLSGFNNPKYFSKCFKKEMGLSPNDFKKEVSVEGFTKTMEKYNL